MNQYPGVFYVDNGLLFCSTCSVVIDHVAPSSHLELYCLCIRRKSTSANKILNGCVKLIFIEHHIIS